MLLRRFKACFERIAPHQARRLPKAIPLSAKQHFMLHWSIEFDRRDDSNSSLCFEKSALAKIRIKRGQRLS